MAKEKTNLTIDSKLKERAQKAAEAERRSLSSFVEIAIEEKMERDETGKKEDDND